jgi:hypothetical protein
MLNIINGFDKDHFVQEVTFENLRKMLKKEILKLESTQKYCF